MADGKPPDVDRMETVDVLSRIDPVQYEFGIDMLWKWKLDEDAVYAVIDIQLVDQLKRRAFADALIETIFS